MIGLALAAALAAAQVSAPTDVTRPVASIVSPIWSDAGHRDAAHEVDQIVARLHVRAGARIADIGAGEGYDTVRLARIVGPTGRVWAEDVTPAYLGDLRRTVKAQRLGNVEVVQGEAGDPHVPARSIDAAVMVHMYHEIRQPMALLARLTPAFRPGGVLGVEELDRPTAQHGTPPALLTCELAAAGYRRLSLEPLSGDIGYFAVFSPPTSPRPQASADARACRS